MATESIKSIRSSGGDYTSLSAWEAGEERDLVTADEIAIAECYDDWPSGLNDTVVISGTWVSDSTRYPIIRCATGHGHDGTPGSGFHIRHSSVSGTAITIQVSYTRVIGLDVANSTGSGSGIYLAQDGIVEKCLCTTNGGNGITLSGTAGKEQVARNNLCYECSADGIDLGLAAARYVYNNTCVGNGVYGIDAGRNNSNQHIKNNLCSGNTSGDYNWAGTSIDDDYNASADTTATGGGGANSVNSQTFSFADAANDDYHLSAATSGGTDLSAATYGFSDDIDGETRSNWDFGFDEYASSGTTVSGSLSAGVSASASQSATSTRVASLSAGISASEAFQSNATINAAILEGTNAGDSSGDVLSTLASVAASANAAAAQEALVSIVGAIAEGVSAGESWASDAQALAELVSAASAGSQFTQGASSTLQGVLSAGTSAGVAFAVSVQALADIASSASAAEVMSALAVVAGVITDPAQATDAYSAIYSSSASISAAVSAGASFSYADAVGYLSGTIVIQAALDGSLTITPSLDGSITLN